MILLSMLYTKSREVFAAGQKKTDSLINGCVTTMLIGLFLPQILTEIVTHETRIARRHGLKMLGLATTSIIRRLFSNTPDYRGTGTYGSGPSRDELLDIFSLMTKNPRRMHFPGDDMIG